MSSPLESVNPLVLDPVARLRELSDVGGSVEVKNDFPVTRYLRSGPQMEKMARTYFSEGQLEQAFILYNKFLTLYIEKLPKHPEYSKAPAADKTRVKSLVKSSIEQAMLVKEKLKKKYEEEKEMYVRERKEVEKTEEAIRLSKEKREREELEKRKREEEIKRQQEEAKELEAFVTASTTPTNSPKATPTTTPTAATPINQQPEPHPLSQAQEPHPPPPPTIHISSDEEGEGGGEDDSWIPRDDMLLLSNNQPYLDDDDEEEEGEGERGRDNERREEEQDTSLHITATDTKLSKVLPSLFHTEGPNPLQSTVVRDEVTYNEQLQATPPTAPPPNYHTLPPTDRHVLPPNYQAPPTNYQAPPTNYQATSYQTSSPSYQTPPHSYQAPPMGYSYQPPPSGGFQTPPPVYSPHPYGPAYQQSPPPNSWGAPAYYQPPPTGTTPSFQVTPTAPPYQAISTTPTYETTPIAPPINRDTKPESNPHVITSLGGLEVTRSVVIPGNTVSRFLNLASNNTRNNIETCGILGGKMANNILCISHIIIPKQTGKADSCETLNEEEIFDVVDKYDLITLGWIHTHPSQTSFMSSVDLHTHCSYQLMLEEAIAIVCAPRYSQVGVYTLTQPHGLNYISKCSSKGFHTHPKEPPLYEDCKHVTYDQSRFIEIIDLRR